MKVSFHTPVLLKEVVDSLNVRPGRTYVDGTVGGGGHAFEILKESDPGGMLIGIDVDSDAIRASRDRLKEFGKRAFLIQDNFSNLRSVLDDLHVERVDGILFDLGVSSHQLTSQSRGFSFSSTAPLDMRMNQSAERSAYDLVNDLSEQQLAKIIREYGEEVRARRVARAIVVRRKVTPIRTTSELAQLIADVTRHQARRGKIHPATKTFQALRIAVNDELTRLHDSINTGVDMLQSGGRFAIISFHSLEDRIVKNMFRTFEKGCICPRDFPVCTCGQEKKVRVLTKKPITPKAGELAVNPRARSAKLRTAERI